MSISASYPNLRPTLLLDFANSGRLDPRVTFTRASTATYFDETGVLQSAAIDTPRFDYDPSTLAAQGFLIEEARTNGIRNNTMQGAVAGTPGTLPTNWFAIGGGLGTLTQQVVGTGTSAGITYIDIRLSGTTSTTSVGYTFESIVQIAASVGQTWTGSFYVARVAGTNTNITAIETRVVDRDAGGANIGVSPNNFISSLTTSFTRQTITRTLAGVGTAFVSSDIFISFSSGAAIDITLRIGLPQLELGAFATSVIPTTTTALTRSADVASVNTLSPWFNAAAGTVYAEYIRYTNATAGRIATFSNGTSLNQIRINGSVSTNIRPDWQVLTGGSVEANVTGAVEVAVSAVGKTAGRYAANDFQQATNGTLASADTSGTVPTVSVLNIGSNEVGISSLNGWLRRLTFYPRPFVNAELQAITT